MNTVVKDTLGIAGVVLATVAFIALHSLAYVL